MARAVGGPTTFLQSMQLAQPHLNALAAAGRLPVRVTRVRWTVDGWIIAFRSGEGRERAVVVDARDGRLRGVEPAMAGPALPVPGIRSPATPRLDVMATPSSLRSSPAR